MRIKTEGEFIAEFGKEWRQTGVEWVSPAMDYLFGKVIVESRLIQEAQEIFEMLDNSSEEVLRKSPQLVMEIDDYSIAPWMIKRDSIDKKDLKAELDSLYRLHGYDKVAIAVLNHAREKVV